MAKCLTEVGVAVLGGDSRQVMVAEALADQEAWVRTFGLPETPLFPRVYHASSLSEAVDGARVAVLPIGGVDREGMIRCPRPDVTLRLGAEFWRTLAPDSLIVTGSFPVGLKEEAARYRLKVFEYAERDEIAIPNAIPTAEGAIQLAMENTPFTIDGSLCLVLGYGRVAKALATRLLSLGARTVVAARNLEQLREAERSGCDPLELSLLGEKIKEADLVFNSIPALVLTAEILGRTRPETLIIDLASSPGGTDFTAAAKEGIKALLALGLPGKVAPKTAGKILASNLPALIAEQLCQ